jgi:hypothetical protein
VTIPQTAIPKTVSELFEVWIPARFAEFLATQAGMAVQPNEHCTVVVESGANAWLLQVQSRQLMVSPSAPDAAASFRLQVAPSTVERFVLGEIGNLPPIPQDVPPPSPLLKLLNLDDEALNLVQNIPGALRLVVRDGDASYTASLGPGSRALTPAACTLSCSLADADLLRTGKVQPMELFFGGRIQIAGDPQVAMGLAGLFM